MAATAITGFTALTAPAVTDTLIVVDDSASDNKKIALAYLARDTAGTGAIVTGAYTLTIPATGTAALLGTANVFTNDNTTNSDWLFSKAGLSQIRKTSTDRSLVIYGGSGAKLGGEMFLSGEARSSNAGALIFRYGGGTAATNGASSGAVLFYRNDGSATDNLVLALNASKHVLINTTIDSAQLTVKAEDADTKGLVINTSASPAENPFEVMNNGTTISGFGPNGSVFIKDGMTAPGAATGFARIYVDAADGDLKVVFADGVVKTIAVDA
jgi:hypothetical protein